MHTRSKKTMLLKLTNAALSTLILMLNSMLISSTSAVLAEGSTIIKETPEIIRFNSILTAILFATIALLYVIDFFTKNPGNRIEKAYYWVAAAAYLFCSALFLFIDESLFCVITALTCCILDAIAKRIFAIFRKKSLRSTIFYIFRIVFIVLFYLILIVIIEFLPLSIFLLLLGIFFAVKALIRIIVISFSQIQFGILQKILRKTYAMEILFGLLVLILSFSFIFYSMDSAIPTYEDALWYSFAIVTTIGFGDFSATNPVTRILSIILGIYGIVVVALVTSVIVNFYSEVKDSKDDPDEDPGNSGDRKGPDEAEETKPPAIPGEDGKNALPPQK